MNKALEIQFSGWTATPRMPFILSGNALCLPVPTYSLLLGVIGCCLGRTVEAYEVSFGFKYSYDSVGIDLEKRQRLEFDGKKVKSHAKGTDAYQREFHVSPNLTIWLNRVDWIEYFKNPVGTPALGRSQDILKIERVKDVTINAISEATISGCMLPFNASLQIGGQLIQLAESFKENEEVGSGRIPVKTGVFMAIPSDNERKIKYPNLFQTQEENPKSFYLHTFSHG
jgi:CRISPR-associated protein Cas5t